MLQEFMGTATIENTNPANSNKKNQYKIDKTQQDEDVELSDYYESIALKNAFNTLENQKQKEFYLRILDFSQVYLEEKNEKGFYTSPIFSVYDYEFTDREVAMIYEAVIEDNPQIFWISDWYAFSVTEDKLQFQLYFTMSEKKMQKCRKQLNAVVNRLLAELGNGMSDYQLELYFHDYIVKNCVYDKNAVEDENHDSFNVYGALVQQKAVCQGYTEAFQLLLSYVGVNSYRIVGQSQGANHIWNVVVLDGENYYVDVTWDDAKDYMMYDYFNITSEQLEKDHIIAPLYKDCSDEKVTGKNSINYNLLSAECSEDKYNYYKRNGSYLSDYNKNTLTEDLIKVAQKGGIYFHINIDPVFATAKEVYNELFDSNTYKFSANIKDANAQMENVKLSTQTYVSQKERLNVITVELLYEYK